jgi:hypothetical protein
LICVPGWLPEQFAEAMLALVNAPNPPQRLALSTDFKD